MPDLIEKNEEPVVAIEYNETKGSMLLKANGISEEYSLVEIPKPNSYLVLYHKEQALQKLSLENLTKDLSRSADLLYLAYNGVAGTGKLAGDVSSRQKEFAELCAECRTTMQLSQRKTNDILAKIIKAFKLLLDVGSTEEEAIEVLGECAKFATQLSDKFKSLAVRFNTLKEYIGKDCIETEKELGVQNKKLQEIKELRQALESELQEQEALKQSLESTINDLNGLISEAKEEMKTENNRAFAMGIIGAFSGMIGTAAGALIAIKADPLGLRGGAKTPTNPTNDDPSVNESKKEKEKIEADKTQKEKEKKEEEEKLEKIKEEIEDIKEEKTQKEAALKDKKAKKIAEDTTEEESEKLDEEIETLTGEVDTIEKKTQELSKKEEETQKKIELHKVALQELAKGMEKAGEKLSRMAEMAHTNQQESRKTYTRLLEMKRQDEEKKRNALGKLASLTSKMTANQEQTKIEEASFTALTLAKFAFDNIYVALMNAKIFWEQMATYCENLADSELSDDIKKRQKKEESREKRIAYFKKEDFVKASVLYIANWKALEVVCGEYVNGSDDIYKKVTNNIKSSPSIAEARGQLEGLKKTILQEIELDKMKSQASSDEISKTMKELKEVVVI